MQKMLPSTIDIRLTSECNKRCEFCFGTTIQSKRTLGNWEKLIRRFSSAGVENIVVTGGEPALVPNLGELLSVAHNCGMQICLSTNGTIACRSDLDIILKNISWLSLPIEGECYDVHNMIRPTKEEEYHEIFSLMKYAKKRYKLGVKIGTVVTKLNINSIMRIPPQIYEYADSWKLYQVYLQGKNEEILRKYSVSIQEYYSVYEICKKICLQYPGLNCICYDSETMNGKYLFCEPNSDAMSIFQNREYTFGNFIDDFESVCNNWNAFVNQSTLEENFYTTYRRYVNHE